MSDGAVPEVERLQAVKLEPGDVLVANVRPGVVLDQLAASQIRQMLEAHFPGHQVVVAQGVELGVVRPAPEGDSTITS